MMLNQQKKTSESNNTQQEKTVAMFKSVGRKITKNYNPDSIINAINSPKQINPANK